MLPGVASNCKKPFQLMLVHMQQDTYNWLALSFVEGLGSIGYRNLIRQFHTPGGVFRASASDLEKVEGVRNKVIRGIKEFNQARRVECELECMRKNEVKLVTCVDDTYPANLLNIYDPPPCLYVKGNLRREDKLAVAVVGSRFASSYGMMITERITRDIARQGITVVSGMARGIDTSAHRGALSVKQRTIAVLGCGLDVNYPLENKKLKDEIASCGAVVSELPMSTPPAGCNFPRRNRIISGMSLGVVVVEASHRSGSLITARLALEQGRDVFAVPGSIDSLRSRGTHQLIKEGAKLVEDARDIVSELLPDTKCLPWQSRAEGAADGEPLSREAGAVLDLLTHERSHIDSIIAGSGLNSSQVSTALLDLELKGLIRPLPGRHFMRKYN
jgi:DNA processing protein